MRGAVDRRAHLSFPDAWRLPFTLGTRLEALSRPLRWAPGKEGLVGKNLRSRQSFPWSFARIRVLIPGLFLSAKQVVAMDSGIINSLLHLKS